MEILVKFDDKEKEQILKYAKSHSLTLEEVFKRALFEKIENEFEIYLAEKLYLDFMKKEKKNSELFKNLDV
ncbi:DUF6290 family protein [Streptobacillus moniliformis]|uniref:DUF6290 family protein n=1 Tax=Streptobacillus moniliformis TaxID=34105 RepID=UPI0007E478A2|nr:DUF6290 family protein [Streptobacillus moniliformis]